LKVLDSVVFCGGGSGFVVSTLELLIIASLEKEGQTYDQLIAQAHWRTK
jgi:hypothetical protein